MLDINQLDESKLSTRELMFGMIAKKIEEEYGKELFYDKNDIKPVNERYVEKARQKLENDLHNDEWLISLWEGAYRDIKEDKEDSENKEEIEYKVEKNPAKIEIKQRIRGRDKIATRLKELQKEKEKFLQDKERLGSIDRKIIEQSEYARDVDEVLKSAVSFTDKKISDISNEINEYEQKLKQLKIPTQEDILHTIMEEISNMNKHKEKISEKLKRLNGKDSEVAKQINDRIQSICNDLKRAEII